MFLALFLITMILAILTILPLWRYEAWWVRGLDFPRLQLSIVLLLLFFLEWGLLDIAQIKTWGLLSVTFLCFMYQVWWIVQYTWLFPKEVVSATHTDQQNRIRLITANVLTPNRNAKALLKLVQENAPDVLVTLETDDWWQEQLDVLEADYPYTVKCPLDNLYGMHVYSKLPLLETNIEFLVEPDKPSIHTLLQLPSGHKVRAHFVHPAPPSPTENEESLERDAELLVVARSVAEVDMPVIVAGDLNDVAWSDTTRLFRKISGLLDPRVGRGMFNTFHAGYWFLRWPLDHLFHSDHFTLCRIQRLKNFGSDHFALFTELHFEHGRHVQQHGLEADTEDLTYAKEKTDTAGVSKNEVPNPGEADQGLY